jgi:uncharacterized protein
MKDSILIPIHNISLKPGEMKEVELSVNQHPEFHTDLIKILPDQPIDISGRLESVSEGVLATLNIETTAIGECARCLDRIEFDCNEEITQLYFYPEKIKASAKKHGKKIEEEDDDDSEEDDLLFVEQDAIDLAPIIRDTLLLDLPLNPLCDENCLGLCPDCGEKWANLPEDHHHELLDPRWSALDGLKELGQDL